MENDTPNEPTTEESSLSKPIDMGDLSLGGAAFTLAIPLVQDIELRKAHLYDSICGMSRHLNGAEGIPGFLGTTQLLGTILLSRQAMNDLDEQCPDVVDRADRLSLLRSALKDRADELKEMGKAIKTAQDEIGHIVYAMTKNYGAMMREGDAEKAKRERQNAKDRKDGDVDFDEHEGGDGEAEKPAKPARAKRGQGKAAAKAADKEAAVAIENKPNYATRPRLFHEEPDTSAPPAFPSILSEAEIAAASAPSEGLSPIIGDPAPTATADDAEPTDAAPAKISPMLDDDFGMADEDFSAPAGEPAANDPAVLTAEDLDDAPTAPSSETHADADDLLSEVAPREPSEGEDEFQDFDAEPVPILNDKDFDPNAEPVVVGQEESIQVLIEKATFEAQSEARRTILDVGFPGEAVFTWAIEWAAYASHDGKQYAMAVVPWGTARVLLRALSTKDKDKKEIALGINYQCRVMDNKVAALRSRAGAPPKLPEIIPA